MKFKIRKAFVLFLGGVLLFSAYFFACSKSSIKGGKQNQNDGHHKMLAILAEIHKKNKHPQNGYEGDAKLHHCDSLLVLAKDPNTQLQLATLRGHVLLELGRELEAVDMYEQILHYVKEDTAYSKATMALLGVAYLRLAERTNCVIQHGSDACIMPIQGNGIHIDKGPARKAIEMFSSVMKVDQNHLESRWLLNIAYMTLGEYPTGVPKPWLIPGLDTEGPVRIKPFTEMAADLGIATNNRAGSNVVEDFNNDGYLDIISSAWGIEEDRMHYFRSNADGTFTDASVESGLNAITGGLNLTHTDYNNDGFMDIFVLRGGWQGKAGFGEQPNSLLRNNGDGTFTDVTIEAGLLSYRPTQTATWNDFNNDGWLDVFIGNETMTENQLYPCEFYINNQNGTFTNIVTPTNFFIPLYVKGVTSGDFDNDGWQDIFLSCQSGQKMLLRNLGVPGKVPDFEDVSEKAGISEIISSTFPTFFFDYDNDGWLDIFTCNYDFHNSLSHYVAKETLWPSNDRGGKIYLFHNNRNGTFTDVAPSMQLNQPVYTMGANFGDIDNDGWLDMYLATGNPSFQSLIPNRMYKNIGGKDFVDVTISARVGNLQKGHGVSFADLNNNGDQDIYVDMGGAYLGDAYFSSFYLNPGQNDNRWICIKLEGSKSNRAGIGARVSVKFLENGVERRVYRDVNAGGSFGSSPFRREIGIGQATKIDEITVAWPSSGIVQVIKDVTPNQFIQITEGKEGFKPIALKALTFKKKDGTIPMCAPVVSR